MVARQRAGIDRLWAVKQGCATITGGAMLLTEIVEEIADTRDVGRLTLFQYSNAVRCYSERLGRPATVDDLNETAVNRWLRSLGDRLAPATVLARKRGITAIWNFAAEQGFSGFYNPRKLRRIRVDFRPVTPWSVEQIRILCRAAQNVPGRLRCGLPASLFLETLVRFHYETGLRPSDTRAIRWDAIDLDRREVAFSQTKTRKPHVAAFSEATANLLARMQTDDPRVFPLSKSSVRQWEAKLWKTAERLGFRRQKGQALGFERKSHGTEVARQQGIEAAARSLGHVSGTLTAKRHYVAADAMGPLPHPPSLDDGRPTADHSVRGTPTRARNPRPASPCRNGSRRCRLAS
jgi:integrase